MNACRPADSAGFGEGTRPVINIGWNDAKSYVAWLSQMTGRTYRLLSEAEWEYAARGQQRRMYPWGNRQPDAECANFADAYNATTAVGAFAPGATPEGLLDMAGNVLEWTRSEYRDYPYNPNDGRENFGSPARKRFTLRGGSWYNQALNLRASDRGDVTPVSRDSNIGFRLARHLKV
jgi:formylglycine-generating enzyme required for sulfatase activity